jgi:catechol 2,3-dioxygenase-like lactoylglutathione lyase family enzyme
MITGVRGTTIWSEDLNRLLPFYRDVLGFPVAIDTPGFVVLGRRDVHTLALGTHSEVRGNNADPARHMVGLTSDDIMADCKRLKDARVEFIEDPKDYGDVWVATFKDPDGNLLQLLQFHRNR